MRSLLARHRDDRSLVFTALAENAYDVARENMIPVITGETAVKERQEILEWFKTGTVRALASARVLNEGVDVPEARVALLVAGTLGAREYVQRIGRVLRPAADKRAVVYELITMNTSEAWQSRLKAKHAPPSTPHSYRTPDGRVVPRWLGSRDEPWLRELVAEAAAAPGRRAREVDARLVDLVARTARSHGASRRLVEAVWATERKRWKTRVDAPIAPLQIRRTVFPLASERSREEAIATAAALLGIQASQVEEWLFADRAHSRLFVAPDAEATTADLVERYNLALVQALLHRATDIRATARAHLKRVVSYAKLLGLMLLFEEGEGGATVLTLSGPLALFHDTIKYGHALARWVPALFTTPGWAISANLLLQGEKLRLDLDAGAPLPRTHAMSKPHDSRLEARLERDIRGCASPWRIEREVSVLSIDNPGGGRHLVFPDFALVRESDRVLVEVVGYWTPEYLTRKAALLDLTRTDVVLCVDEKYIAHISASHLGDARIVPSASESTRESSSRPVSGS